MFKLLTEPTFLLALITLLGLLVGSFLNVVIYRLPIMMDRADKAYGWEVLHGGEEGPNPYEGERFDLMYPPSRCPNCGKRIRPWQNIPVLSYLLQGCKCAYCRTPISPRYMAVELLTALLSFLVARNFSDPWQLTLALLFTWSLIALFFIDLEHQLLPDSITLPLLWLGLAMAALPPLWERNLFFTGTEEALQGAIFGYLILWLTFWLFKLVTGKEGMGYGDFKLLAVLGAWEGAGALPFILFVSSLLAVAYGFSKKVGFGRAFAYGPFLIIAGWLNFMYAPLISNYLALIGL